MMPVMESRAGDQPFQRAEAKAHGGMDEETPDGAHDRDDDDGLIRGIRCNTGQSKQINKSQAEKSGEYRVKWMPAP